MHPDSIIPTNAKNRIELVDDGSARVYLTQGQVAIIDAESIPAIAPYRWNALGPGPQGDFYAVHRKYRANGSPQALSMHRLLTNAPEDMDVDHWDGDGLNNRMANLRIATRSQNQANRRTYPFNTTGYKGVSPAQAKTQTWRADINMNGIRRYLGRFPTAKDAAIAYDNAARELHGPFARLNFPKDGEQAA